MLGERGLQDGGSLLPGVRQLGWGGLARAPTPQGLAVALG